MKVIGTSNFGDETVAEYLVEDNLSPEEAQSLAFKMNDEADPRGTYYYRSVDDDRKLWGGMAELV